MLKSEVLDHIGKMIERHQSVFVLGRSYMTELNDNIYFDSEEKQKISELLELVIEDIIEHKAILTDLKDYVDKGDENQIY